MLWGSSVQLGRVCTLGFHSVVTWWSHVLGQHLMSVSLGLPLVLVKFPEKTLAASFLVELMLAACILKFGWDEETESLTLSTQTFT